MTMADVERDAEHMPWGPADEIIDRLIDAADPRAPARCSST